MSIKSVAYENRSEMANSFYVVLPSNASYKVFPNNKLHTYKVQIPKLPSTEGEWSVGLTEITYPSRWPNLKDTGYIYIKWNEDEAPVDYAIEPGFFSDVPELLSVMHDILSRNNSGVTDGKFQTKYDKYSNKVLLAIFGSFEVSFSANLAARLGFESNKYYSRGGSLAPYPADVNDGATALYVYSDIVQKRLVGDDMLPLLKVVPAEPRISKTSHKWVTFQNVEYVPAVKTNVDTIEINIRRDDGQIIPFENGKVVVTLHFKQIQ